MGFPPTQLQTILSVIDLSRATAAIRSKDEVFSNLDIEPDRHLCSGGAEPIAVHLANGPGDRYCESFTELTDA